MTASNYDAIREENVGLYGTAIGKYGPKLLGNRYAVRSHFIYELLQNAEDALGRRQVWTGPRSVTLRLGSRELRVSHYGAPFTEADVRSISSLVLSTKDGSSIGRFGIGFKSVYAFTDRPEIHSGDEHFAIESYVYPVAVAAVPASPEETVFVIPLRDGDTSARQDIEVGLRQLGARTLLFLREIEEIDWSVESGASGSYLRVTEDQDLRGVRRVTLLSRETGQQELEETWTVFSREVRSGQSSPQGRVEIAFLNESGPSGRASVEAVSESPLVVWFPTVVPTYLGFLVQGPYSTTLNRDNVLVGDPWNDCLVQETAKLLVEALRWLRDHDMLDTAVLECLPIDAAQFQEGSLFSPLFTAVREALGKEPLLPCYPGGYVPACQAKLARTQELRDLLNPNQLGALYGAEGELHWISGDVSQDRTPDLRKYLLDELDMDEATPDAIVFKLDKAFLEEQSDDWIVHLYEFLNGQPALLRQGRLHSLPLVRLEDGTHVEVHSYGQPEVFLPSPCETGFPTVRRAVCATDGAMAFLASLGLAEADLADDVVRNVLPKYGGEDIDVRTEDYEADMHRILAAWHTDSTSRREKLQSALRGACFVRTRECATNEVRWARPEDVYFATDFLKELFGGVAGTLLVDDTCACLRGDDVSELLAACGCSSSLQSVSVETHFTYSERSEMRKGAGFPGSTDAETIEDWSLRGLEELLCSFPLLDPAVAGRKAALLWDALCDVEEKSRSHVFAGTYHWFFYTQRACEFDAAFVRQLNSASWVPDRDGKLQPPGLVSFETTGWKRDAFLQSKIHFMPPAVEVPSEVEGVDLKVLDLLKRAHLTTLEAFVAALPAATLARLGIIGQSDSTEAGNVQAALEKLGIATPTPSAASLFDIERSDAGRDGADGSAGTANADRPHADMAVGGPTNSRMEGCGEGGGRRAPGSTGGRPFISYVGVQPDDEDTDPDGLDQQARMALEEKAIALIVGVEPVLHRTLAGNPGYDLVEGDEDGLVVRWVEVKAMTGDLHGRPVGLSRTQFEWAREHGDASWLYVVEHADSPPTARIVRIQDPAGKARTFTFDYGWLSVAQAGEPVTLDEGKQSEEG